MLGLAAGVAAARSHRCPGRQHKAVARALSPHHLQSVAWDLAEGLEEPVQFLYIATLLGFAAVGAYLVVRQVIIRRDLEEAAKVLGERIRSGDGNSEVRLRRLLAFCAEDDVR